MCAYHTCMYLPSRMQWFSLRDNSSVHDPVFGSFFVSLFASLLQMQFFFQHFFYWDSRLHFYSNFYFIRHFCVTLRSAAVCMNVRLVTLWKLCSASPYISLLYEDATSAFLFISTSFFFFPFFLRVIAFWIARECISPTRRLGSR